MTMPERKRELSSALEPVPSMSRGNKWSTVIEAERYNDCLKRWSKKDSQDI